MKLKTKLLTIIAPAALLTTVAPIALTSCGGGGGDTPTGDRTNKISWTQGPVITYGSTFTIDMTLDKELASGQKITGLVSNFSGTTGGTILWVEKVDCSAKKATVHFKYTGEAPKTDMGVDQFNVKFTGSTNDKTEWTNTIEKIRVTFSK